MALWCVEVQDQPSTYAKEVAGKKHNHLEFRVIISKRQLRKMHQKESSVCYFCRVLDAFFACRGLRGLVVYLFILSIYYMG